MFTLESDSHHKRLAAALNAQRVAPGAPFCDIVLRCGLDEFPCHRAILCIYSEYWAARLTNRGSFDFDRTAASAHEVELSSDDGADGGTLKAVLDFCYEGTVSCSSDMFHPLIVLADRWCICELLDSLTRAALRSMHCGARPLLWHMSVSASIPGAEHWRHSFLRNAVAWAPNFIPRLIDVLASLASQIISQESRGMRISMLVLESFLPLPLLRDFLVSAGRATPPHWPPGIIPWHDARLLLVVSWLRLCALLVPESCTDCPCSCKDDPAAHQPTLAAAHQMLIGLLDLAACQSHLVQRLSAWLSHTAPFLGRMFCEAIEQLPTVSDSRPPSWRRTVPSGSDSSGSVLTPGSTPFHKAVRLPGTPYHVFARQNGEVVVCSWFKPGIESLSSSPDCISVSDKSDVSGPLKFGPASPEPQPLFCTRSSTLPSRSGAVDQSTRCISSIVHSPIGLVLLCGLADGSIGISTALARHELAINQSPQAQAEQAESAPSRSEFLVSIHEKSINDIICIEQIVDRVVWDASRDLFSGVRSEAAGWVLTASTDGSIGVSQYHVETDSSLEAQCGTGETIGDSSRPWLRVCTRLHRPAAQSGVAAVIGLCMQDSADLALVGTTPPCRCVFYALYADWQVTEWHIPHPLSVASHAAPHCVATRSFLQPDSMHLICSSPGSLLISASLKRTSHAIHVQSMDEPTRRCTLPVRGARIVDVAAVGGASAPDKYSDISVITETMLQVWRVSSESSSSSASAEEENLSADLSRIRSKYRSAEAATASNSSSSTSAAAGCEPTTRLAALAPRLLFEWDASLHSERPERLLRLLATDSCIVVLSEAADDPRCNMLHTFVHNYADV